MPNLTIRNLSEETRRALRMRAARHRRSTEADVRTMRNVLSEPLKLKPVPKVMEWLDNQSAEAPFITAVSRAELRFGG
jgi:plasmid stability protein